MSLAYPIDGVPHSSDEGSPGEMQDTMKPYEDDFHASHPAVKNNQQLRREAMACSDLRSGRALPGAPVGYICAGLCSVEGQFTKSSSMAAHSYRSRAPLIVGVLKQT